MTFSDKNLTTLQRKIVRVLVVGVTCVFTLYVRNVVYLKPIVIVALVVSSFIKTKEMYQGRRGEVIDGIYPLFILGGLFLAAMIVVIPQVMSELFRVYGL